MMVACDFLQITFPFFGDILGFIGALGTGPTTFWIPSLMWLIVKKPGPGNVRATSSALCRVPDQAVSALNRSRTLALPPSCSRTSSDAVRRAVHRFGACALTSFLHVVKSNASVRMVFWAH